MKLLSRSGFLRRKLRQIRRKTKSSSPTQVLLETLASLTTAAQVAIPAWWAYRRAQQSALTTERAWIYVYLATVLFSLIYRNFLAKLFSPRRLEVEVERRPMRLSGAISKFTVAEETDTLNLITLGEIERQMLEAITSEVEAKTGDVSGVYLNASLIIPDPADGDRVRCINRSNTHREFPKTYQKDQMIAWQVIRSGKAIYQPDYRGEAEKPYRSILSLPLTYQAGDDRRGLGCVSIDHSRPFEFDDLEKALQISLSPYLRVLELALIHRSKLAALPWRNE